MIYILMFLLSGVFIAYSERLYKKNNRIISYIFAGLALVLMSIFAGLRDTCVGTDVEYYVQKHFNWVKLFSGKPLEYIGYMYSYEEVDPIYALIVYISSRVFGNIKFVLFMMSLITNLFVYLGIKNEREKISVTTGWLIYCLLIFNVSLNIIRQTSACAVVFYIMVLFFNDRISLKKYLLLSAFSICIHRTAVIMIVVLSVLNWLTFKNKRKWLFNIMIIALCLMPFSFSVLPGVMSKMTFLPAKYVVYFLSENVGQSKLLLEAVTYTFPTILLGVILKKRKGENNIKLYCSLALVSISTCMATNLMISRLSYYVVIFFTISIPYSAKLFSMKSKSRYIYNILMIFWIGIMWYVNTIYYNYGETYPYILG